MMRFLSITLAMMVVFAASCKSTPDPEEVLDRPDDYDVVVHQGQKAAFVEPVKFEHGVGLHARAEGMTLVVSARNQRPDEVIISAPDLAVITGPNMPDDLMLIHPGTADLSRVGPMILKPGQPGIMTIPIKVAVVLPGTRLVYNNPRKGFKFFVDIQ